jgi:RimJ/RimL family protein N-acetyltransferase
MTLQTPTLEQCELVRQWRNAPDVLPMLRTKEPLTKEQQEAFYRDVVCNPASNHRYYALMSNRLSRTAEEFADGLLQPEFIGLGGLTYLDRTPGEGEISLLLGPQFRGRRLGAEAVQLLRMKATLLGLRWVVGECYDSNPARRFWIKQVARCDGQVRYEPDRIFFRMSAA